MRKSVSLTKKSLKKIDTFIEENIDYLDGIDKQDLVDLITNEVKLIKECSEASIVDIYLNNITLYLRNSDIDYDGLKKHCRSKLAASLTNKTFDNNVDIYFNEIKRQYIEHPIKEQDDLEFNEENKEIFIKNNLKQVITCAKKFTGLGLPFEDLIQAGNVGLMTAFEKFDKNKANLRIKIINSIKQSDKEVFSYNEAKQLVSCAFDYSKNLEQTTAKIPTDGFESKSDFIEWANSHIKTAAFSSVAFKWIMAYIRIELNKYGKTLRIPTQTPTKFDPDIDESIRENLQKNKYSIIQLDSENNYTEDQYHDDDIFDIANEAFLVEDTSLEVEEQNNAFKDIIARLLNDLDAQSRRIIKKRFGIDIGFEKSISEIAYEEGLSDNKVKYIINSSFKDIMKKLSDIDKESIRTMLR